jgi:hypothetical protein
LVRAAAQIIPAEGGTNFSVRHHRNTWRHNPDSAHLRRRRNVSPPPSGLALSCAPAPEQPQSSRVLRGGSWNNNPQNLRSANRNRNQPDNPHPSLPHKWGREGWGRLPSCQHALRRSRRDHGPAGWASKAFGAIQDEHGPGPRRDGRPIPRQRLPWETHGAPASAAGLMRRAAWSGRSGDFGQSENDRQNIIGKNID